MRYVGFRQRVYLYHNRNPCKKNCKGLGNQKLVQKKKKEKKCIGIREGFIEYYGLVKMTFTELKY